MTTRPRKPPGVRSPATLSEALRVFVRFASPMILLLGAVATSARRLGLGQWSLSDLAVVIVLIGSWPLVEWLVHVLLLHWKPRRLGRWTVDPINARSHRRHHAAPNELQLLFIPVHTWLYLVPAIVAGWLLLAPTVELAWTGIAATFLLGLHYEWCHFLAHVRYTPKVGYYRRMCRAHVLHHFKSEKNWYGVSMTAADLLLGTSPPPAAVRRSATCLTLGVEPLGDR